MGTYIAIKIEENMSAEAIESAGLHNDIRTLSQTLSRAVPEKFSVVVLTDADKKTLFSNTIKGAVKVLDIQTAGSLSIKDYL